MFHIAPLGFDCKLRFPLSMTFICSTGILFEFYTTFYRLYFFVFIVIWSIFDLLYHIPFSHHDVYADYRCFLVLVPAFINIFSLCAVLRAFMWRNLCAVIYVVVYLVVCAVGLL